GCCGFFPGAGGFGRIRTLICRSVSGFFSQISESLEEPEADDSESEPEADSANNETGGPILKPKSDR
ncbi:MAG: hypothetical protein R6W89_03315, partial [Candidatus Hydrogenedentota bacterium]